MTTEAQVIQGIEYLFNVRAEVEGGKFVIRATVEGERGVADRHVDLIELNYSEAVDLWTTLNGLLLDHWNGRKWG